MINLAIQPSLIPYHYNIGESSSYSKEEINAYTSSSSYYPLREFHVGETCYKLLSPIDAFVNFDSENNQWECIANKFDHKGVSIENREAAIDDFKLKIHIRFQQLYAKRPFEMTEEEHVEWVRLANTIDLLHYRTTTPIKTCQIGCISYKNYQYPYRIKWLTDENYIVDPSKVPGELMSYKPGQWVEAIVERQPVSHKVLGISSIKKIRFHIPRSGEAQKHWDEMEKIELDKQSK